MPRQLNLAEFENENETGTYVLDFRPGKEFVNGFVPGSFYISPRFLKSNIRQEVIQPAENLAIIAPNYLVDDAIRALEKVNYENIVGWLKGGYETWLESGNNLDVIISIEPDELMMDMKFDDPQVIDIRSEEAYFARHLEGAENIPVENLLFNLEDLPKDGIFYMYCDDGELSLSIISCLKSQGFHNFYHVTGGFDALLQNEAAME